MAAKQKARPAETGKIAALACLIVVALSALVVSYLRSNPASGTIQAGPVQHITLGARERRGSFRARAPGQ